jgi:hypothetical protein
MEMTPSEIEAIGILRGTHQWGVYIGYIEKLLNAERDRCVVVKPDMVQVYQGRARAFREVIDIENTAEKLYNNK